MTLATHKRWADNPWHNFIPRKQRASYQGIKGPKGKFITFTAKDKIALTDYNLQLKQCAHRVTRAFANNPAIYKWSIDDQTECLDRGFFLHRSWPHNAVNIISARMIGGIYASDDPFSISDGDMSYNELHRIAFAEGPSSYLFFRRMFKFIDQQDYMGFSDAWEHPVDIATKCLRWYKARKQRKFTGIVVLPGGIRKHISQLTQVTLNTKP